MSVFNGGLYNKIITDYHQLRSSVITSAEIDKVGENKRLYLHFNPWFEGTELNGIITRETTDSDIDFDTYNSLRLAI